MFKTLLGGFETPWMPFMEGEGSGGGGGGQGGGTGGEGGSGGDGGGGTGGDDAANKAAAAARRAAEAEAKKANDKTAQELGYKDHADMLAQIKASKEKDLTEAQREKARAEKAEADKADALARSERRAINAELKLLAKDMGCDPDVAVALADRTGIKVGDDDTVTGAKEALEALQKAKPNLFGDGGGGEGAGGTVGKGGGKTTKTHADIAAEVAKERKGTVDKDPWA